MDKYKIRLFDPQTRMLYYNKPNDDTLYFGKVTEGLKETFLQDSLCFEGGMATNAPYQEFSNFDDLWNYVIENLQD